MGGGSCEALWLRGVDATAETELWTRLSSGGGAGSWAEGS